MTATSDTLPTATRVADPGIRALYRLENRWQAWLDVEAALARAQAELGIIPAAAAEAIAAKARLELMDRPRIDEGFTRTGHTLLALGFGSMTGPSRALGDHLAENICILGLLAATCGKIGREVYTLMKTEFGEVEEPVPPGTVGSSTMPQKRNPKLCQDIIAAAAEVRSTVPLALEAMQTEHEADRTTSVMMDAAEGRAAIATGDMRARLVEVWRGLRLDPERMRANLDLGGGLIMAEAVMLNLGKTIGRQHAHDVVYEAAQSAFVEGKSFGALLAADPGVRAHLDPDAVA